MTASATSARWSPQSAGLADRDGDELGGADLDEPLEQRGQRLQARRHDVGRVDAGSPLGQEGGEHVGDAVERVRDERAEVLGIDLPVVLGGDPLDLGTAGGDVVGRAEARAASRRRAVRCGAARRGRCPRTRSRSAAARDGGAPVPPRSGSTRPRGRRRPRSRTGAAAGGPRRSAWPARCARRRRPAARPGRPARARTPAAAARRRAGRGWPAPWPAASGCARAAP